MLNLKTIFKQKSKILLTIICIFGLAFSYSCRSPEAPKGDPTVFSASLVDAESVKTLVVKSDGTFSREITLKFSSANTIDTITPTAVSQNDLNLTKDSFTYDKATGKLTISGLDTFKDQDGGTSKNINDIVYAYYQRCWRRKYFNSGRCKFGYNEIYRFK